MTELDGSGERVVPGLRRLDAGPGESAVDGSAGASKINGSLRDGEAALEQDGDVVGVDAQGGEGEEASLTASASSRIARPVSACT